MFHYFLLEYFLEFQGIRWEKLLKCFSYLVLLGLHGNLGGHSHFLDMGYHI